jgi:uncharacterized protein YdhG (YjbR/CyaY superfamily)
MAKTDYKSVDGYIGAQPAAARSVLKRVRAAIRAALPRAEEGISYQIPAYKQDGRAVIYFAGWKEHYSLYPVSERLTAALGKELAPYTFSKGTMRLPLDEPVPAELIARIAKLRAKEVAEQRQAKEAPRRRRKDERRSAKLGLQKP